MRMTSILCSAAVAMIFLSGAAVVAPNRPTINPGLRLPSPPVANRPAVPSAPAGSTYTMRLACPADANLFVDILPYRVPAGWTSTASGLALNSADVGEFQGKQTLSCKYDSRNAANSYVSSLNHSVALNSCIVAPDKKSFLCKPGTE